RRTLDERDEPSRADPYRGPGRRAPLRPAVEEPCAQVEDALVVEQLSVAHVERLVVDEQADDLPVRHVDDRLTGLRVAVAGLRVRQRPELVERVEVGPRQAVRLALVEVRAQPDVAVREREHRLGLREHVEVEAGLANAPGVDAEGGVADHRLPRSSSRSSTTTAPWRRRASAWPARSMPTTKPKRPARPASTPASASSKTAASAASTPSFRAAARKVSGAGLPARCSCSATIPSIRTSNSSSIPAATSTSRQFALDETTARRSPASRAART